MQNSRISRPRTLLGLPEADEIHIWRTSLLAETSVIACWETALSHDERVRAGTFHSRGLADKFVAAHGVLRSILAWYAGVEARDVEFVVSAYGKPSVRNDGRAAGLQFNMSHAGDVALIAVSRGREVGVDIERVTPSPYLSDVAHQCFCPAELAVLDGVPDSSYLDTFFTLWTRKEAYVKARGEGLSRELKSMDVSAAPALVHGGWFLDDLAVDKGYRAAIAVKGSGFWMTHCADVDISSFSETLQNLRQPAHQDVT